VFGFLSFALLIGLLWFLHKKVHGGENSSANTLTLDLPFAMPCAVDSADASTVYIALKRRDRHELTQLFVDRRMISVAKGLPVRFSFFGPTAMVTFKGGPNVGASCFVPSDIVSVIRRNVVR
jgi:hypothetical protein